MTIGSVNFSNPSLYPTTTSAPASQPTAGPALPQESVTLGQSQAKQPSLATLSAASQGSVQGVDSAAVAESGSGLGKAVAGAAVGMLAGAVLGGAISKATDEMSACFGPPPRGPRGPRGPKGPRGPRRGPGGPPPHRGPGGPPPHRGPGGPPHHRGPGAPPPPPPPPPRPRLPFPFPLPF